MIDLEATSEWEHAVGRLILTFGNVELVLMSLYQLKIPSRDYFTDSFDGRFDKLIGTLKSDNAQPQVINALIELKQLAKTRHLLAHNPLYVVVHQHQTTGQIKTEMLVKDKAHATKRITLPCLQAEGDRASELVSLLLGAFQSELWRG